MLKYLIKGNNWFRIIQPCSPGGKLNWATREGHSDINQQIRQGDFLVSGISRKVMSLRVTTFCSTS